MPTSGITDWGMATWAGLAAGMTAFFAFLPNILGAALILLIGWVIAKALFALTDTVLDKVRFDSLMSRIGVDRAIDRSGVHIDPSNLVATLVKWAVLLVAFMMAAEQLGLTQVSMGIASILGYIPNVIAAVVILGLGLLLAGFVSSLVRGAASSAGMRSSDMLADLTYWAIGIFAALGAIGQLNIAPTLVQTLYTAVIAAIALGAALAFGLGLREQARDVVAGRALSADLEPGAEISLPDRQLRGRIEHVGALHTMLRSDDGTRVAVPNHMLGEAILRMGSRLAPAGGGGGLTPDDAGPTTETGGPSPMTNREAGMPSREEHAWRPKPEEPPTI